MIEPGPGPPVGEHPDQRKEVIPCQFSEIDEMKSWLLSVWTKGFNSSTD